VAAKPMMKENVVHLFDDTDAGLAEATLDLSHLSRGSARPVPAAPAQPVVDLTGRPKAVMAIGLGSTGKTTLLRWICEMALERDDGDQLALATVDPVNRELGQYFQAAMAPKTQDPVQITAWLEKLLTWLMTKKKSAAVDFGGGDTTLGRLVNEVPDLQVMMEDAGVEPVALYLLSPRSSSMTPLAAMEQAGFKPKATALILNEGTADSTRDRTQEFAQLRRHSTYRAAIARGAVEIWMPRLYAAKAIEDRRLLFHQAVTGEMPAGRGGQGLGVFDRSRTRHWLAAMNEAFAPIASWLP
jgi:hypothetical protein